MISRIILSVLCLLAIVSCGSKEKTAPVSDVAAASVKQDAPTDQKAERLQGVMLVSKGVIKSVNEVKVFSRIEGQLKDVKLIEGQRVGKGSVLFALDDWELKTKVVLCESEYEQAKLRMEEILVVQGYKRGEFQNVPQQIVNYAKIKSGFNVCERELEINKEKLSRATIKASQGGVVTGINVLSYSFVKPGETLCTIVDPDHLMVEFSILETELSKVYTGAAISVYSISYPNEAHKAVIRSVGSVVDNAGMIKIEALIEDTTNLIPGMTAIVNL